jgi:nanoRNase/pAp phosphatase (c-di-AMP/oligoRNAs hydrolase)
MLDELFQAVKGTAHVLILPHNDPDPDAIAAALALRCLLAERCDVEGRIVYKGIIGRAENKALVNYLNHPLYRLERADLRESVPIALVDTQPGAGNNSLPTTFTPAIVIDHHPLRQATAQAFFADVRPQLGSTSTILTEYLQEVDLEPSSVLATALFYGIKTDTLGLVRGASPADAAAYFHLQPRVDVDALLEIERAQVPAEYFKRLSAALNAARVFDQVVIAYIGSMTRPDMAAEMADLLLRLKGVQWAVCMGLFRRELVLAVRTRRRWGGAGELARAIVGSTGAAGGHGAMAGGQIPLRDESPELLAEKLTARALEFLQIPPDTAGVPLI